LRRWITFEGRAEAQSGIAGIRVLIEGTSIEDETNADGAFSLRGDFEGDIAIRFELPTTGATASIAVNVPAGGTLTLDRVHIDAHSGQATTQSQTVRFEGVVTGTQCAAETLQLISSQRSPTDTDVYDVNLDGSSIRDANGLPLPCQALRLGDHVRLLGIVEDDGSFGDAEIVRQD
jgi:cytoskeletal protein CcmA (bactofilin family)